MTRPELPTDWPERDATGEAPDKGTIPETPLQPEVETIFDPDLFEELRETIGTARMRLALEDLASILRDTFLERTTVEPDRGQTFKVAHMLTGRAGLMGFTALHNACVQLQQACASRSSFGEEFARTSRVSVSAREAIMVLLTQKSENFACAEGSAVIR